MYAVSFEMLMAGVVLRLRKSSLNFCTDETE